MHVAQILFVLVDVVVSVRQADEGMAAMQVGVVMLLDVILTKK